MKDLSMKSLNSIFSLKKLVYRLQINFLLNKKAGPNGTTEEPSRRKYLIREELRIEFPIRQSINGGKQLWQ